MLIKQKTMIVTAQIKATDSYMGEARTNVVGRIGHVWEVRISPLKLQTKI